MSGLEVAECIGLYALLVCLAYISCLYVIQVQLHPSCLYVLLICHTGTAAPFLGALPAAAETLNVQRARIHQQTVHEALLCCRPCLVARADPGSVPPPSLTVTLVPPPSLSLSYTNEVWGSGFRALGFRLYSRV